MTALLFGGVQIWGEGLGGGQQNPPPAVLDRVRPHSTSLCRGFKTYLLITLLHQSYITTRLCRANSIFDGLISAIDSVISNGMHNCNCAAAVFLSCTLSHTGNVFVIRCRLYPSCLQDDQDQGKPQEILPHGATQAFLVPYQAPGADGSCPPSPIPPTASLTSPVLDLVGEPTVEI